MPSLACAVLVAVVGIAGCLRADAVDCGGHVCPGGHVCVTVTTAGTSTPYCVQPEQLGACAGVAEGTPCALDDDLRGTCHGGACFPDGCGNGLLDASEACDDGNEISGDGCSGDCASTEVCGNQLVDPVVLGPGGVPQPNERCDDGSALSHDGCSSRCDVETPRWTQLPFSQPTPVYGNVLVTDWTRGAVVMFGGDDAPPSTANATTWIWNGMGWAAAAQAASPNHRARFGMAFEASRDRVIAFGGCSFDCSTALQDTWIWDGVGWDVVPTTTAPSIRFDAPLAYDAARDRVVLFGGESVSGPVADTWEWDGAAWHAQAPAASPPPRAAHAMAYDPVRARIVLFGGRAGLGVPLGDTWLYDGLSWSNAAPPTSPSPRQGATMTWDPERQRLVLFGGTAMSGDAGDTWEWDGTTWTRVATTGPAPRYAASLTADPIGGGLVLHGGLPLRGDTWRWKGGVWIDVTPAPAPALDQSAITVDTRRQRIVAFGGDPLAPNRVTAELADGRWILPAPTAPLPAARAEGNLVFDATRGESILWGGSANGAVVDGTWAWNGSAWRRVTTTNGPNGRGVAEAYDADRGEVIAFGASAFGMQGNETWVFDGATWSQRTPTSRPSARWGAALAWDPIARKVVLFGGGVDLTTPLNDVWDWDGTTWSQRAIQGAPPPARYAPQLVWHPARQRLVLFGGANASFAWLDDVWELEGATWTRLDVLPPPRRDYTSVVSVPQGLLRLGGVAPDGTVARDGWLLRWDSPQIDEVCEAARDLDGDGHAGCDDPDCWARCTPTCPPGVSCPAAEPRCGDGVCAPALETCRLCPADCVACPTRCGDLRCDGGETAASCPGDC